MIVCLTILFLFSCGKKNTRELIESYNKEIKANPNDESLYYNRGFLKLQLDDTAGALVDFNNAIAINPEEASVGRGILNVLISKNFREAIKNFDKAIEINPNYSSAYEYRGKSKFAINDDEGAIEDFIKAIELDPNNSNSLVELLNHTNNLTDYKKGIDIWDRVIMIMPHSGAYQRRAYLKNKIKDYESAIEDLNEAIKLYPEDFKFTIQHGESKLYDIYFSRGAYKFLADDMDGCIKDFDKALDICPENKYRERKEIMEFKITAETLRDLNM